MLDTSECLTVLSRLGYLNGIPNLDIKSTECVEAIRKFQSDLGLEPDGIIGKRETSPALTKIRDQLVTVPKSVGQFRRWRLTSYYLADENDYFGPPTVPIYNDGGSKLATVSPRCFAAMALEGTGKLLDGRLLSVSGKYVSVSPDEYRPIYDYAYHQGWVPDKLNYAGIKVKDNKVIAALAFELIPEVKSGLGYGMVNGIPYEPFKTLAADIGRGRNSDPTFKGKGGVVPLGTKVFILEYFGKQMPDGSTHNGWFVVNDTGGGINGAHFDVFTGTYNQAKKNGPPSKGHIWFADCETRISINYTYGL